MKHNLVSGNAANDRLMTAKPLMPATIRSTSWQRLTYRAWRWGAAGLVLTSCACSSLTRPVASNRHDPFLTPELSESQAPEEPLSDRLMDERPASAIVRLTKPTPAQQVQYEPAQQVQYEPLQQVQYEIENPPSLKKRPTPSADRAIERVAAEAWMPLDCPSCPSCPSDGQSGCPCVADCQDGRFPDEYLCDGGDRDLPVHYSNDEMQGLDSEDTVAEFYDDEGRRRVRATNKVCFYAPRFAAVEVISAALADVGGDRPTQSIASDRGSALRAREASVAQNQNDMMERLVTRSRGSSLLSADIPEELDRPQGVQGHVHSLTPLESYSFLSSGQLTKVEGPWLAKCIQSAVALTRDQNPVITAVADGPGELTSRFSPEEFVGRENQLRRKLRIVKLADTEVAAQGDVVTFKIRFDNLGDVEIRKVVIVDNLTPRLEYVEDSATCDREGEFFTDDNGDGSLILRWELDKPLPGRTGGVVTFKARVR
ncbi:MAG: DUF11 domain-containing protein [Planctomycetaceae bacterium]|nr:DUF11 domain-containing protein [Planctomycetaceae bacterium]